MNCHQRQRSQVKSLDNLFNVSPSLDGKALSSQPHEEIVKALKVNMVLCHPKQKHQLRLSRKKWL